ncbi:MAG: hypothetical protein J6P28_02785 [Treponema sp.]|nr:hypothetical protein [Treponema sp.]
MKKSIALFLLFLLIFLSPTVAEDLGAVKAEKYGSGISFRLPYRNAKGRSKYFNEEVESALIVDKILVNGKPVITEPDYAVYFCLTDEYITERIPSSQEFAYISMGWRKDQNKNWVFAYRGDLFVLAREHRQLFFIGSYTPSPLETPKNFCNGDSTKNIYLLNIQQPLSCRK